jgi:hypothetical protein
LLSRGRSAGRQDHDRRQDHQSLHTSSFKPLTAWQTATS